MLVFLECNSRAGPKAKTADLRLILWFNFIIRSMYVSITLPCLQTRLKGSRCKIMALSYRIENRFSIFNIFIMKGTSRSQSIFFVRVRVTHIRSCFNNQYCIPKNIVVTKTINVFTLHSPHSSHLSICI